MQRTETNLHLVPITSLPISHIQIQYLVSSFTILTPTNLNSHHDHCVLLAGKGSPELPSSQRNSVQYLSMYDNKVLRKFRGHTDAITDISMSPAEDTFLTSSRDRTVRYVVRGMPSKGTLLRLTVLLAVCAWSGPDICLFDPNTKWIVGANNFFSKSRNCPWHGKALKGMVKATYMAGKPVFQNTLTTSWHVTETWYCRCCCDTAFFEYLNWWHLAMVF